MKVAIDPKTGKTVYETSYTPADLEGMRCLPEIWHVQAVHRESGQWMGWYQFFHPNPELAREEAQRLREELPFVDVYVGKYTLAEVEGASVQSGVAPKEET